MSKEKIEYTIICVEGGYSHDYSYDNDEFYGVVSSITERWDTCTEAEYQLIRNYVRDMSTSYKKYMAIRHVENTPTEKPNFSLENIKSYYKKIEEEKQRRIMEDAAKKALAAEKRKQSKIKKLMSELGMSKEQVENLLNGKQP